MLSVCTAMSGYFLFRPAQSYLKGLTIILSYEFHTCSFIHAYTACIQISFMHGCTISLILIVQNVSSRMCLSRKCYQSCISQVAGPTKTVVYQCLFISPVFPPVWLLPHWGDWRYFLSYVGRYPIEVIDGISFRMLIVTPLRWLTVFPFVCWSLPQ